MTLSVGSIASPNTLCTGKRYFKCHEILWFWHTLQILFQFFYINFSQWGQSCWFQNEFEFKKVRSLKRRVRPLGCSKTHETLHHLTRIGNFFNGSLAWWLQLTPLVYSKARKKKSCISSVLLCDMYAMNLCQEFFQ